MAKKTFAHAVIWHGELIPANTPIEDNSTEVKSTETVVKKNDKSASRKS